jgi:proline iminopeptidase
LQNFGRVNGAMLASLGDYDWRARLAGVTVPVLVIHGTKDPIPLDAAREWAAGFPDGRLLTIQNSGHFPWIEQPGTFFPAIETFLGGSWPTAARAARAN